MGKTLLMILVCVSNSYADTDYIKKCSPKVHPITINAVINTESSGNPYSIAVVSGAKQPQQPKSFEDAVKTINNLEKVGANYSVGIAQINKINFKKYNVSGIDLLDICKNLRISQEILADCYVRSKNIQKALSCYYSGNFIRGFKKDYKNTSYVERIYAKADKYVVPSIYDRTIIPSNKKNIIKKNKVYNSVLSRKLSGTI